MKLFTRCLQILFCSMSLMAGAQITPTQPTVNNQPVFDYKTINPKLKYAFIANKPTSPHPQEGDQISLHMLSVCNNRLLFNSRQAFKGKPGIYGVAKPAFQGDLIEAIMLMTPGDSIVCLADADAIFKSSKSKRPDFIKSGDKIQYFLKLVSIKPKLQVQKEQQEAFNKQIKAMEAKQKAEAAKQIIKDDKILKAYFTKNKLTPVKTNSGLYYIIKETGKGDSLPVAGDNISVNYTGTFLDGKKFDSNVDTAFRHVSPLQFMLGKGSVIKGWEEGFALLKPGAKAIFYVPSTLAYGQQTRPGSPANPKGIPANSILIFDVDLLSCSHPPPVTPAVIVQPEIPKTDSLKKSGQ